MDRKISLADVQKAVYDAYENYKSIKDGAVNPDVPVDDADKFGVSVMLTDGTVINKGDTDIASPMGSIAKIGVYAELLSQNSTDELVKKFGCCCKCAKSQKPQIGVSARGVRMVSAVSPQNDRDGKYDILVGDLVDMIGSQPVLDDKMYESLRKKEADEKAVDMIAAAGFELYDDTDAALDVYTKLISLQATAGQAAVLGATVAADGRNPKTGEYAFDGSLAPTITSLVALAGPHHEKKAWMLRVGVPAKRGYAGLLVAIMPGFGAIAAYAPRLDENGVSVKAAKAIRYICNTLQLNIHASARVSVEK